MKTPKLKVTYLTDEELGARLAELEQRHGMTSTEFLHRFNGGELGDDFEFLGWAGLLKMRWWAQERRL